MPAASAARPSALVWLRNDLRTRDHAPLAEAAAWAAARGGRVVPVYCVDPRHWGTLPHGYPKTGVHRARFLLESLADLRAGLRALGGDLVVRRGTPEDVLPALARKADAGACFYHEEVASEETTPEAEVEHALAALGVASEGRWGHTLLHPDDLPFTLGQLPEVFTAFRGRVEGRGNVFRPACAPRITIAAPAALPAPGVEPGALPTLAELGHEDRARDPRSRVHFAGGETAGLARLERWTFEADRLGRYKATRNGLLDPDDASRLSPWLAHGCLSPRTVYEAVQRYERAKGRTEESYWLVFELLWRDYFRFIAAKHGDRLFRAAGLAGVPVPWRSALHNDRGVTGAGARDDLERWRLGETGFPLVDAAMRELAATGYTSNRTRQNVASFLTKNLGVDWRAGAEWFESVLVDYDVASNWGNWAYAAGVGNDARGFRFFNIYKQADDYDPDGAYVRHWLPALAGVRGARAHRPDRLHSAERERAGLALGRDYPAPMVDLFESAAVHERQWTRAAGRAAGRRDYGR